MSHPLMYVLGETQNFEFPLILVIGREPNYDGRCNDSIEIMCNSEFGSMKGGVWATAYTQIAKQYLGDKATAGQLKKICFAKNASPIVFSNALPIGIPNSVRDKDKKRNECQDDDISRHISKIFGAVITSRYGLVVQHGACGSRKTQLAAKLIEKICKDINLPYCSSPFFYNGNSKKIQECLGKHCSIIRSIFEKFNS
ncbi:MAG: hypothetical protein KGQ84_08495 [Proteobacteria bacterium]|nr:hypothetical protein [Pseudomonadota bacterium]